MSINELFNSKPEVTAAARGLKGTAELTNLSAKICDNILLAMEADIELWRPRIQTSTTNSDELDKIIDELGEINVDDAEFLSEIDGTTIDNMLRSQQSKRSRTKSKVMTMDNYRSMMTAAVAENIIRTYTGKPKHHGRSGSFGTVDYTGAQLEELAADQDRLRKEIRNVQSKKSIMKSKEGFSESDERWLQLLKAEQQLKDLRTSTERVVEVEVDTTRNALTEMLGDVDITKLKSADAHELLAKIAEMTQQQ